MRKKILLVGLWFPLAVFFLAINLTFLSYTIIPPSSYPLSSNTAGDNSFTATGGTPQVLSASVIAGDARTLLLESFLRRHNSPMTKYAQYFVQQADAYQLDFRLLPAIAMCESGLGKRVPLIAGRNPFGIAVYTGSLEGKEFDSWEHAIAWVAEHIYTKYYSQGRTTLLDIETNWAPPSAAGSHEWSNCVQYFQESIQ